jgi:hypothetical protein
MGFSGNTKAALSRLRELKTVPSRISKRVAVYVDEQYRDMFAGEHDPYRRPWAALAPSTIKRKGGNSVILYRIGALNAGTHVKPARGAGVLITLGPNAIYAQEGDPGKNRPPRLLLPLYGIPAHWRAFIRAEAEAMFAKAGGAK